MLSVSDVLNILEQENISNSRQVVLRWIRQGDLKATLLTRKEGYRIAEADLKEFISERKKNIIGSGESEYERGYHEAIRTLLSQAHIDSSENLILTNAEPQYVTLKAAQKIVNQELLDKPIYTSAIEKLFQNLTGGDLMDRVCIFQFDEYYKIANLVVSKKKLYTFTKELKSFKASKGEPNDFTTTSALLYYYLITTGSKVK